MIAPLDLLNPPADVADPAPDLTREILRTASANGVTLTVEDRETGPTVTRYLLRLGDGVDPRKVERLMDALSLAVEGTTRYSGRIGGTVGIEVPNPQRRTVTLREVILDGKAQAPLGVYIGQDVGGRPVTAALANAPHLLIAGATGQGKSVALNALLVGLLMNHTPADLELVLIDPKRVELAAYAGLPHLVEPIITDMTDASLVLDRQLAEMERRYREMEGRGVKTIRDWNDAVDDGGRWARRVIVIDELADLMMTHGKAVEDKIARLGQVGRAAGIHLVVATQRPSADIVTSRIKAQLPSRLAFFMSSRHDASVVEVPGAERLAGQGDGLWKFTGREPIRVQTPYVTPEEVERVVGWWRDVAAPVEEHEVVEVIDETVVHEAAALDAIVQAATVPGAAQATIEQVQSTRVDSRDALRRASAALGARAAQTVITDYDDVLREEMIHAMRARRGVETPPDERLATLERLVERQSEQIAALTSLVQNLAELITRPA
jgi:S-DNA-T family DNA segregation ATPase FtsK/SpoIIIE